MPNTLDSVPYPLTPQLLERLTAGGTFQKAHPEVITSRYSESEGSTTVVPAVLLVTDSYAYALVEAEIQNQLLAHVVYNTVSD